MRRLSANAPETADINRTVESRRLKDDLRYLSRCEDNLRRPFLVLFILLSILHSFP